MSIENIESPSVPAFQTLQEALRQRAERCGAAPAFTYLLDNGERIGGQLTYGELDGRARSLGAQLRDLCEPGERVLLAYPPGLDFIAAFFGCLYAGVIAVPAPPPANAKTLPRLLGMVEDARPRVALSSPETVQRMRELTAGASRWPAALQWLSLDAAREAPAAWTPPAVAPSDTAFLQYTSGSTGTPKGVMVSHGNLLANARAITRTYGLEEGDVFVSWLPPHHDFGLIGGIITPVVLASHSVQFSPAAFLMRPHRWLKALSDWRARITGGPNFAYALCAQKVSEAQKQGLDLSCLRVAVNGAERVRSATLREFEEAFASCGLRPGVMAPSYGLAESTLLVSASVQKAGALAPKRTLSRQALAADRIEDSVDARDALELVAAGEAGEHGEGETAIVDPRTRRRLPARAVGEIWVRGPSVAAGYWRRPEDSAAVFGACIAGEGAHTYLRTGDLGFADADGRLYVTGRLKEMMIFHGENIYPQDIEATVEALDGALRANGCAAFAVEEEETGQARLVLVQELESRAGLPDTGALLEAVRVALYHRHGISELAALLLVKAGHLPRTSSGKIQRVRCRQLYEQGGFEAQWEWRAQAGGGPAASGMAPVYVAPGTPTEAALAHLWQELLGVDTVSVEAEFLALGGHSLLAGQIAARVRDSFGVELTLPMLFEASTVRALARRIDELAARQGGASPAGPALQPQGRTRASLSPPQQRLWFLDQYEPGSVAYNIPVAVRLRGRLERQALQEALNGVIARHAALRTRFIQDEAGEPLQHVEPELRLALAVEDIGGSDPAPHLRAEARTPFDLARGPLLRARLLRQGEEEHLLLLTVHHIVSDGWSMGVLVRELGALYAACLRGQPAPLAPLPIQYPDYAAWRRATLQGEVLEAERAWWSRQLAAAPLSLDLPADRPRREATGSAGLRKVLLPPTLVEGLEALARHESGTLFMTVLAGLQVLLSRYSGQEDFLVGLPFANRGQAGTEGLVGLFFEPLVFRANLAGNPTFRELLARTRRTLLEGFAHPHVPFESLSEPFGAGRDTRRAPLFQVLFNQLDAPLTRLALTGLRVEELETGPATTELDLTVTLGRASDGVWLEALYNADLFEASTVERMLEHLQVLLGSAGRAPESPVRTLPLLSAAEQRRMVVEWNTTREGPAGDTCVHALIESQAARTPEALAVVAADGGTLTYAQLMERARRLAHFLRARGVGPETRVGLCLERSLDMLVAVLGILEAGAAYVPLDSAYPAERLSHMVEDSGIRLLLVHALTRGKLAFAHVEEVCLDEAREAIAACRAETAPAVLPPEAAVYVLYTSGSTGRPKGVVMPHRALVNYSRAASRFSPMSPGDRLLQFASISWDTSAEEIFTCLTQGGTLVLRPSAQVEAPESFLAWCEARGITTLNLPTAFWHELVASLEEGHARLPRGLRWVLIGGERAVPERVAQWMRRVGPAVPLINTYGITEVMAVATSINLTAQAQPEGREVCIGRPVLNVRTYVLDAHQQLVPVGVTGELYVGGEGVARGYLDRPELTAGRFVPDPFASEPGRRLYRSGDQVRWRADGTLEYLGRGDAQVKVRGFRIEPGEVEAALLRHPRVHEVLVLVREDAPGDKQLVAYAVPRAGQALDVAELRGWLTEHLPAFMVPQALVALAALPLLPNGKVDRKALPAPRGESQGGRHPVEPRTAMEKTLARIWADVLKVDRVGLDDDFFALGGHSLLAMRVVSQVGAVLGLKLPLRELFQNPRLVELAACLERQATAALPAIRVAEGPRSGLPLSYAQQRLWFLDQLAPGSASYSIAAAVKLTGDGVEPGLLQGVFEALSARHETLRTVFQVQDGQAWQVIRETQPLAITFEELSGLEPRQRQERARELIAREAARPFDLSEGPLMRVGLLRLGAQEHVLLVTMHHIISDGWSIGVLVGDVARLYEARRQGRDARLAPLPVQYADYAVWQRELLRDEHLHEQLRYWQTQLQGAPALLELPTDRPRPALQSHRGASYGFQLPAELTRRLRQLAQQRGATLFMVLEAAFAVLLNRYSRQDDICVGTPIAGRSRAELEGLIGFFVNALVLRSRIDPRASFEALLQSTREVALEAYAHQDLPFEQLVEHVNPRRSLSYSPLFQVMFALQNAPGWKLELPGLRLELLETETRAAQFDLSCALTEVQDHLAGLIEYSTDLFDEATIARFARHYEGVLAAVCDAPGARVGDLPLLTLAEKHQLLTEWNATEAPYPGDKALHQLFEEQAARTPDAVALVDEHLTLSYAQLNEKANQLARRLRELGVGPEQLAGICAERGCEMVVGLLGILKAGGGYLPLDPDYPPERLKYMLSDARPRVLLTQQKLLGRLPDGKGHLLCLDRDWSGQVAGQATGNLESLVQPDNVAYVIYTSGSTGQPKGVGVPGRCVVNVLEHWRRTQPPLSGRAACMWGSISFDVSVFEIFQPLTLGAALHMVPKAVQAEPAALMRWMGAHRIALAYLPPAFVRWAIEAPDRLAGLHLQQLLVGVEPLPEDGLWGLRQALPGLCIVNAYGPTESTIYVTSYVDVRQARRQCPLGRPIANTRLYLLDAAMQPVPVGVAGEVFIAGDGLARGYLNRPELTAERFIPNPFGAPGTRLYRTGDLASYLPDGNIQFIGRTDHQVKVRGFRIELGEVEAQLARHPHVAEALVVVRGDSLGEKQLVAYVTPRDGLALDVEVLRASLGQALPEHMVPAHILPLAALPLTPNGKVDREALPVPQAVRSEEGYVAPRTPLEQELAAIWADVLGLDKVGIHDNFFSLGGHSLLATQAVSRLRARFVEELPLQALFEDPTVAKMSKRLEQLQAPAPQPDVQAQAAQEWTEELL